MFTDIVGYTALMGENEQHAFDILEKNRELQGPLIGQYNGELIKELGDGILASFPNATDAVLCAMEIQTACNKSNAYKLRIGIHMAEVVFQNNDVFGDGVNVASRIQALTPPGGIWISEAVRQNVFNKKEIITRFVCEEKLKNVKEPVGIHEVIGSEGESFSDPSYRNIHKNKQGSSKGINPRKRLVLLFIPVLLLIIIGLAYLLFTGKSPKQIKSIAVMPFVNETQNTEVEYLSDGITETLISYLSQLPDLDVKARSSVFRYKGRTGNTRLIGKELDVQAVLTGRLMQRGQELSVYIELVDPGKETVIWTRKYRQSMTSLVSLQSEITLDVVQKLKTKLSSHDEQIITKNYTSNSEAYNHYLKGRFFWNQRTKEGLKKANEEFQQAIAYDSTYALAYSGVADTYTISRGWTGTSFTETFHKAKAAAMRSLEIDSSLAEAHASMGLVYYHGWQWREAENEFKKSIALNPRYASAYQWYGLWLEVMGKKKDLPKKVYLGMNYWRNGISIPCILIRDLRIC